MTAMFVHLNENVISRMHLVLFLVMSCLSWTGYGAEEGSVTQERAGELARTAVENVASIPLFPGQVIGNLPAVPAHFEETLLGLEAASEAGPPSLGKSLLVYRATAHLLVGQEEKALTLANEGIRSGVDTAEMLNLLLYASREDRQERRQLSLEFGLILPLTRWGRTRSEILGNENGRVVVVDPPAPEIPKPDSSALTQIGSLLESMGLYRDAINTYVEALYCGGSWRHEEQGQPWLHIAGLERELGERELAIRAYLKAVYYGGDSFKEAAAAGLQACLSGEKDEAVLPGPEPDAESIRKIASFYRQQNMHPLALQILKRGELLLPDEDFTPDIEQTAQEWQGILQELRTKYGPDQLFDHKIADVKDWSEVRILRPSDTFWKPSTSEDGTSPEEPDSPQ